MQIYKRIFSWAPTPSFTILRIVHAICVLCQWPVVHPFIAIIFYQWNFIPTLLPHWVKVMYRVGGKQWSPVFCGRNSSSPGGTACLHYLALITSLYLSKKDQVGGIHKLHYLNHFFLASVKKKERRKPQILSTTFTFLFDKSFNPNFFTLSSVKPVDLLHRELFPTTWDPFTQKEIDYFSHIRDSERRLQNAKWILMACPFHW